RCHFDDGTPRPARATVSRPFWGAGDSVGARGPAAATRGRRGAPIRLFTRCTMRAAPRRSAVSFATKDSYEPRHVARRTTHAWPEEPPYTADRPGRRHRHRPVPGFGGRDEERRPVDDSRLRHRRLHRLPDHAAAG